MKGKVFGIYLVKDFHWTYRLFQSYQSWL